MERFFRHYGKNVLKKKTLLCLVIIKVFDYFELQETPLTRIEKVEAELIAVIYFYHYLFFQSTLHFLMIPNYF